MPSQGKGLHHLGLATHDMDATLAFYERVLGFPAVVCEMIDPSTGGVIRHGFIDAGRGEMLAFMEANDVPELEKKRDDLRDKGVEVTDVVDHGWCKSVYFLDPNGLQLEF